MGLGAATAAIAGTLVEAGIGATAATIASGVLVGAGTGALVGGVGSALSGGKPLQGALMGGLTGAVTGGIGSAIAGPAAVLGGSGSAAFSDAAGNLFDAAGNVLSGPSAGGASASLGATAASAPTGTGNVVNAAGNSIPSMGTGTSAPVGGNPLASTAANVAGSGGGAGGTKGGINWTNLALGALSGAGSLFSKPQVGTWSTPGPSSVSQGPTFNAPLNTNFPGRTAVNPMPGQPASSWYTYGQNPEPTYFQNNSTAAYGFAKGGALEHELQSNGQSKPVRGPGTGVSDSIPARLSNGEFILTADDVSRIGNPKNPSAPGANDRGAAILNRDRKALAKLVGQKQFPPKRSHAALNESSITHRGR